MATQPATLSARARLRCVCLVLALLCAGSLASAHVGSPAILHDGEAGRYRLFVAIDPPPVIPGVATLKIRSASKELRSIDVVPVQVRADVYPPKPERARRDARDPQYFTADLWIMTPGAWKVLIIADGAHGPGELSVPIPGLPSTPPAMGLWLALGLGSLGLFLSASAVSIVGAAVRAATLAPGQAPPPAQLRHARRAMLASACILTVMGLAGAAWWSDTAQRSASQAYRPLELTAWVNERGRLLLRLRDPGWLGRRRLDDLVDDHGHLMHLYLLRVPALDQVLHIHPDQLQEGLFGRDLPALPAGRYQLFGDIVHRDGLAETLVAQIEVPQLAGHPLAGDDSAAATPPKLASGSASKVAWENGSSISLVPGAHALRASTPLELRFAVRAPGGEPAPDLELYMGMLGHLAVVHHDLSVFAHVHPTGTVSMAALAAVESASHRPQLRPEPAAKAHAEHATHLGHAAAAHGAGRAGLPSEVVFPYAFPRAGSYRLLIQVKQAGVIRSASFDVRVAP